ncbi:hypothetical protein FJT64_004508 [Amphibalanus amphitrite]|uniref:C3HC-type domain-containing protein n=1 Tax=Amphibalanus amphitrite TaxID=1232801 RepID=A0A6A4VPK7_AMPAM|nr:hypothetical protein FJT64_004508 [Amphibalanus amphitrite]
MTSRGREELLARLATFTPARWPGEPLSALECARRGWRLEAGPLLRCAACEAAVPARLPSAGRHRLRAECTPAERRRLAEAVARLAAADVLLPADAAPLEPSLEPERSAALLTEALGSEPPHSEREMIALSYGLAGWELASNERFLRCTFGCRTWDTSVRPSPEDAAVVGGQKTPAAGDDLIQNALDECGLEELDFEMSEEPDRREESDTGGTRDAEQEGGSPVTEEEGEQEEPPAVSVDEGDKSVSSGRSEEGDGGSEAAPGSDGDGGSQGGDEPPVGDRCTDESSQESRSEDSSEGGEEARTPEPSDSGAARDSVDPPSAILTTPTAAANTTPTATVTTPTASEDPSHAAETATTAALSTPIAADDTPLTEQQARPGKRPADSPTTAGSAAKRARRRPAGPLDGHRCWCPWVAGVDGGEPGWRRAVAALSAVGQPAGERCWLGDAALDTMRRVWATLDQWTSPAAAKPALRA